MNGQDTPVGGGGGRWEVDPLGSSFGGGLACGVCAALPGDSGVTAPGSMKECGDGINCSLGVDRIS